MATSNKNFKVKNGLDVSGTATASSFVKTGGTSAEFLMADGSVSAGGGGSLEVSQTPPISPSEGDIWYNSQTGQTFVYYDSFWVENISGIAGPQGETGPIGETGLVAQASAPVDTSTLWLDTDEDGVGIPLGGTAGQVLAKIDSGAFNTEWIDVYTTTETDTAISTAISSLVDSAPTSLNTLNELAAALNDDENFASTITTSLSSKAPTESPTFTGTIIGAPAEPNTNSNTAKNLGYVGLPQVILNSGNLTLSKAHAGEHIYVTGGSQTITIPANSSVPFEIGTTIVIVNAAVTSSIAITADTLILAGTSTTGTRTLSQNGMATIIKITSTSWIISGNGLS